MSGGAAGVVRSGDNVNPCADFADTVVLEVREETGVVAELGAVLGMRHGHGKRRQKMHKLVLSLKERGTKRPNA